VLVGGEARDHEPLPLLRDRSGGADGAQAFVCRGYRCELPTDDPAELRRQLEAAISAQFARDAARGL